MQYISLAALASIGLLISLYFLLLNSGRTAPAFHCMSSFCRIDEQTCKRILSHPDARLLGVPNFVLGLLYYALVLALSFWHTNPVFLTTVHVASWMTVALAVYLLNSLYYKIRVSCQMCLASHAVNLGLFLLLLLW